MAKSNNSRIPDEICLNIILSRLPVRSVITCKCVCKTWLDLISNPDFVQMHLNFHSENSTNLMIGGKQGDDKSDVIYSIGYHSLASSLLNQNQDENNSNNDNAAVRYEGSASSVEMESLSSRSSETKIDSLASSSTLNLSGFVQMDYPLKYFRLTVDLFGSCNGLVCLWFHDDYSDDSQQFFCLWNPATKEYKKVSQAPNRFTYFHIKLYAFLYDPVTKDYKFVIVLHSEKTSEMSSLVHIYSLESDSWATVITTPFKFPFVRKSGVLVNGNLHWLAMVQNEYCIASLDISNKVFKEIQLPTEHKELITMGVLEGRLCILVEVGFHVIEVWTMQDYGVRESWTKSYTIRHDKITKKITQRTSYLKFMWYFKNGGILFTHWGKLVLYDPKHGSATERSMNSLLQIMSEENYSESLVSLNSGTYVGGRTTDKAYEELQILRNRNSVLELRNAELEACNADLQKKLHECQVAYTQLPQCVDVQKEAEKSNNVEVVEETATIKAKGRNRKVESHHNSKEAEESNEVEKVEETATVKAKGQKRKAENLHSTKEAEKSNKVEEIQEIAVVVAKGRKRKVESQYNTKEAEKSNNVEVVEETATIKAKGRNRKAENQHNSKEAEESNKVEKVEETATVKAKGQKRKAENQHSTEEAEESNMVEEVEETATIKAKGRKRKAENQPNTRKASRAVSATSSKSRESTDPTDESPTVQQRSEEDQLKPVPSSTGLTLKPYKTEEGRGTLSNSKDSYQKMTVEKLRALLRERGLMVKGRKEELIARLIGN